MAPLGLGAYFAYLIASLGPQLLQAYVESTIVYYSSALVYFLAGFSLYAFFAGGLGGVKSYWKNNFTPSVTALGTCSSIARSEEHTSELQSIMRISYAVFCLKKNI